MVKLTSLGTAALTLTLTLAGPVSAELDPVRLEGPTELHLATSDSVVLTPSNRSLAEVANYSWSTNIGRVELLTGEPGLRYIPPPVHYPQVAIVGAYDPVGKRPIVHVIELVGNPTVEVNSEPNVSVVVQVGGASFGPQPTDAAGLARIPVEAHSGIDTAITLATDPHGNVTRGELALNPPPFPRVLALCASSEAAVYVIEVTPDGKPAPVPTFVASSSALVASEAEQIDDGVFRVSFSSGVPLDAPLNAKVMVKADEFTTTCGLVLTPPPVALPFTIDGTVTPVEPDYPWIVGARFGWLTNTQRISGPWVSARGAYALSHSHAGFRVELEAGYSQTATTLPTTDAQTLDLVVRTWPILASARYVVDWSPIRPMVAIGLGATLTQVKATGGNVLTQDAFATPWLGGGVGGLWWRGPHELELELSYAWANNSSGAIQGNMAGVRAVLGYQYAFAW